MLIISCNIYLAGQTFLPGLPGKYSYNVEKKKQKQQQLSQMSVAILMFYLLIAKDPTWPFLLIYFNCPWAIKSTKGVKQQLNTWKVGDFNEQITILSTWPTSQTHSHAANCLAMFVVSPTNYFVFCDHKSQNNWN